MALHMVRYTVKPGRSAENEELLDAVFEVLTGATLMGILIVSHLLPERERLDRIHTVRDGKTFDD